MREAAIIATARTGVGRAYRGVFNDTEAPVPSAHVVNAAIERAGIAGTTYEALAGLQPVFKGGHSIAQGRHIIAGTQASSRTARPPKCSWNCHGRNAKDCPCSAFTATSKSLAAGQTKWELALYLQFRNCLTGPV